MCSKISSAEVAQPLGLDLAHRRLAPISSSNQLAGIAESHDAVLRQNSPSPLSVRKRLSQLLAGFTEQVSSGLK